MYIISVGGWSGFGDHLLGSLFVNILNDNKIPAVLDSKYSHLVEAPIWSGEDGVRWNINYFPPHHGGGKCGPGSSIIENMSIFFKRDVGVDLPIVNNRNHIPVKYHDIPNISATDVVIGSKGLPTALARQWTYFKELKENLNAFGISYVDLDEQNIKNIECLNYVKKCKLYLGLETGTSHYVSQFANGKGIIIQSGFTNHEFWSIYDYEFIETHTKCSPCFDWVCSNECQCIKDITVLMVLEKILNKIGYWKQ